MMRGALVIACIAGTVAYAEEPKWPSAEARRLGDEATALHKEAQQTKDSKKYEQAHKLYQEYLARFHDLPDGDVSFFDAELLFRLQRYGEAARQYERVTTLAPTGKYAKDAAYAFMVATKNAVQPAAAPDAGAPCPGTEPCTISADLQRLVTAFDTYIKLVPESPELANVWYRKARVYYEHNHFAEAAPLFDHVFTTWPQNELATYSANLEMDCLAILKRYDGLRALVERVKKSPAMKDAVTQKQVADMDAGLKKKGK